MYQGPLKAFFAPKTVAVVGASASPGKVGNAVVANMLAAGFKGRLYPVNPKGGSIEGLAVARSVAELPGGIDLAVFAVPRDHVLPAFEALAGHGLKSAIVLSAGFREAGREGYHLERRLTELALAHGIAPVSYTHLDAFGKKLGDKDLAISSGMLLGSKGLGSFLDELHSGISPVQIISYHDDKLRREERGYGDAAKPQDYLDSFRQYIDTHKNDVTALKVVLQRPRDLTRQQLRELKLLLDEHGYSEVNLRTAWREATNQDIAASIIGFIRQLALGSPLMPYQERVDKAMKRILASRAWTAPQRQWLERIGAQMRSETIVDRESLNSGQFQADGGFKRLDKVFDGKMEEVLGEINDALWQDAG